MKSIRVHANYKTVEGPWGGANGFLRSIEKSWARTGRIELIDDIEGDYDILFLNAVGTGPGRKDPKRQTITPREVRRLKATGHATFWKALTARPRRPKKLVVRSIGIEKWSFARPMHTRRDRHVIAVMNLADCVIFQTAYMEPVFRASGFRGMNSVVIHNGADPALFHRHERRPWDGREALKVLSCTFSQRASKRFDLIAQLARLPGLECSHIGNWPDDVPSGDVKLLGVLDRKKIGEVMRASHILMHPAVKDPCPNVVQEAQACGLPVLHSIDSGAAELAQGYGVSLDSGLGNALTEMRTRYQGLYELLERDYYTFTADRAADQYLQVFKSVCEIIPHGARGVVDLKT
jgi:glycosyltransferase involved in cell wall biosynthesis